MGATINEYSFPWDAEEIQPGEYDREYMADEFAEYFRDFISSGIFMKTGDELGATANSDMSVTLNRGRMIIDGYKYKNKEPLKLTLDPADGINGRVDRLAITWDQATREIYANIIKGTPSANPTPQAVRRDSEFKDYIVADILVKAGAISIKQGDITDKRLDPSVCGLAYPFVDLDTSDLFNQIDAVIEQYSVDIRSEYQEYLDLLESNYREYLSWVNTYTGKEQAEFEEWFEKVKNQLDTDQAGHLQNQVDDLKERTEKMETSEEKLLRAMETGNISFPMQDNAGQALAGKDGEVLEITKFYHIL